MPPQTHRHARCVGVTDDIVQRFPAKEVDRRLYPFGETPLGNIGAGFEVGLDGDLPEVGGESFGQTAIGEQRWKNPSGQVAELVETPLDLSPELVQKLDRVRPVRPQVLLGFAQLVPNRGQSTADALAYLPFQPPALGVSSNDQSVP